MKVNLWTILLVALMGLVQTNFAAAQDDKADAAAKQEEQEPKKENLQTQMRKIFKLLNDEKFEDAVEGLKGIAKENPDNPQVVLTLVNVYQTVASQFVQAENRESADKYYLEGAQAARAATKLTNIPPGGETVLGSAIYNEACVFALQGKKDQAMTSLKEAFDLGFNNFELASTDKDFGEMVNSDEFKSLLESSRKAAAEKMIAKAKEEIKSFESFDFKLDVTGTTEEKVSLSALKGKVVIVDFWGTWCPPCRAEIPSFIKLKDQFGDQLEIIGLAYENGEDEKEKVDLVNEYIKENKLNYPCALGDDTTMEQITDFQGFPTTLFIDRSGKVRMLAVGLEPYEKLLALTKELLDEK